MSWPEKIGYKRILKGLPQIWGDFSFSNRKKQTQIDFADSWRILMALSLSLPVFWEVNFH